MPQLTEPANLPPAPFTQSNLVLANTTLRQTIHTSVGGQHVRLRFSNAFGGVDLPVTAVSVALPAAQRRCQRHQPGTARPVTFDGQPGIDIPVGSLAVSDPLDFPLAPRSNLTVTLYLAAGQRHEHHIAPRLADHVLSVAGNHISDPDLPGATSVDHWYFLSGVEVWSDTEGVAIVATR